MASTYGEFFYFGICHFCKDMPEKIQRCGSCKTVAYCSKQHQKSDWRKHKGLCRAIALTHAKTEHPKDCSFEEWKSYRISCQMAWIALLQRQLQPFECQMWMFPRACGVCYSRENLKDCPKCRNVAYCSKAHAEQDGAAHDTFCNDLKLCMDIDRYLATGNAYPETRIAEKIGGTKRMPACMDELMDMVDEKTPTSVDQQIRRVLKADSIAPGATILYAMDSSQATQRRGKFVIHLVGSSSAEGTADWGVATELVFHWTPSLQEIAYVFVGPEAWDVPEDLELCPSCRAAGKTVSVEVHRWLYHEIVGTIEKPDLVVSFNSGLHEFEGQTCDQWQDSIPFLLKNVEVPFAFTSYTEEEMTRDMRRIEAVPGSQPTVLLRGKNPFASPRPIRDWCTKDAPVFYSSGFIAIVKRIEDC